MLEQAPKMLFLTSPNNPDGSTITDAELLPLLDLPVLVVLDEAYIEFAPPGTSRSVDLIIDVFCAFSPVSVVCRACCALRTQHNNERTGSDQPHTPAP